ncbi:hypothetical protein BFP76_05785 [Amylibacter kogurei]|uniref:Putative Flp pilus-assembly TadG-like N-terminal domain-containing protein n=1 Tax=Paramylibacter kogurei TaxID=1889778 RepID=A0A2G5K6R7_9RHOB|nr:TadE/TadG family type IV pilus assembly protein [Amylibacter kogurei]PIB24693.1 hypothetical protein BFP76_05785 [Amylibacter kogurei]
MAFSNFKHQITRFKDDESGSFILFVLFLFVSLFVFGGMAVDIARYENTRVRLQTTLDSAIFAVAVSNSDESDETVFNDFFAKSGLSKDEMNADWDIDPGATPGEFIAWASADSNNLFLSLYGISKFDVDASASIEQEIGDIEISLVVDVSASMSGTRIQRLRTAVIDFATDVFANPNADVSVSIIPFDYQTSAGPAILDAWAAVPDQALSVENILSDCIDLDRGTFVDGFGVNPDQIVGGDYSVTALTEDLAAGLPTTLQRAGEFRDRSSAWLFGDTRGDSGFNWNRDNIASLGNNNYILDLVGQGHDNPTCRHTIDPDTGNSSENSILPFADNVGAVTTYINNLQAEGSTAGDLGIKWGLALLDPTFRPTVDQMITNGDVDPVFAGRPHDYTEAGTMKVIVHLSDGANTLHQALKDEYRSGPSGVYWHEETQTYSVKRKTGPYKNRYFCASGKEALPVLPSLCDIAGITGNAKNSPLTHSPIPWGSLPIVSEARQLDMEELTRRFSIPDIIDLFYGMDGIEAEDMVEGDGEYTGGVWQSPEADARMLSVCSLARGLKDPDRNNFLLFTIGFEVPAGGLAERALKGCVNNDDAFYEPASNDNLSETFRGIAAAISKLRLTS